MRLGKILFISALGFVALSKPLVVGINTIVADIAQRIAGEELAVVSLIPPGVDPHAFEPTSQDLQLLLRADLILRVGAGLEEFPHLLDLPEVQNKTVDLSEGLPLLYSPEGIPNPHVWLDPVLVSLWAEKMAAAFSRLCPEAHPVFLARKEAYQKELQDLDRWIREEVEKIPAERRLLVTDHYVLSYFAARYGFKEVGAILPSESSLAEPSARELGELIQNMKELGVPAVFVTPTFNMTLAERVAAETGAKVVVLYLGALTDPEGPAPDYLSLMRENVRRIVEALRG